VTVNHKALWTLAQWSASDLLGVGDGSSASHGARQPILAEVWLVRAVR
jgi:hypothetical protein